MTVINTNVAAQITANAMKSNNKAMETTMERLATGFRINSAGDDAAGLGIGSKMTSQIRGLDQSVRNANDAISMLQTADGASVEIGNMLQRMRELAVQAKNGTNSDNDLTNLNKEFAQLANEIERVADKTTFNGQSVMNGTVGAESDGVVTFNVGHGTSDTMSFTFRDFEMDQGSTAGTKGVDTLVTSAATFSGYGATDEMHITNSAGDTVIVDVAAMVVAGGASHNFTNITFTELVTAINTQIDAADDAGGFEGLVATDVGSAGTSIAFTQDTAGTGDVLSIKRVTAAGVMTDFGTLTSTTVGSASGGDGNPMAANISDFQTAGSQAQAADTIAELDAAITGVDKMRADFGSVINRLEYTVDNLNSIAQNTRAARSAVMDADYASETTELARTQIISQASTAMLSQANQQAQSVLALLK